MKDESLLGRKLYGRISQPLAQFAENCFGVSNVVNGEMWMLGQSPEFAASLFDLSYFHGIGTELILVVRHVQPPYLLQRLAYKLQIRAVHQSCREGVLSALVSCPT